MLKAIKEAKVNSSWIQPNEDWEAAVKKFIAGALGSDHGFRAKIEPVATKIAWHGMLNSIAQAILKFTVPGVPDIYQGTELWDFNLVDPDDRRPVDFVLRKKLLAEVQSENAETLFKTWQDGRIKMSIPPGCSTFGISRRRFSRPEAITRSTPTESLPIAASLFPGNWTRR
jgi:(1->4)-alpha-D-glucan 1-alpha-D-glucosylmutase